MLKNYTRYGAITTKVRAMYGRLLSESDFKHIDTFKTLAELFEFLGKTPGLTDAMSKLGGELTPDKLSVALRSVAESEHARLYRFGSRSDRTLLKSFVYRAETIRYAEATNNLRRISRELSKKALERLALEADLVNICSILRLHRSFSSSLPHVTELLIPVRDRLTDSLIAGLSAAKDEAAAIKLMGGTVWGKYFPQDGTPDLELLTERAIEAFCRRLIAGGEPGPYFPYVYLTLREIECAKLNRAIGAIRYGMSYNKDQNIYIK